MAGTGEGKQQHKVDARAARIVLLETEDKRCPPGLQAVPVKTPDGFTLRAAVARPARARGTVVLLPGRGEYIERHYETIGELLARRFAVVDFDWRGQGLSQRLLKNRLKGHVRSFDDYEVDLEAVMRRLVLPDMPPPYHALGISMGGHVLLKASWKHVWFERAMLVSPFIDFAPHPRGTVLRRLARLGGLPGLSRAFFPVMRRRLPTAADFAGNSITHDRQRYLREVKFLQGFPEVGVAASPTFGWLHAALRSVQALQRMVDAGGEPRWPMLALAAAHDALVDAEALRRMARVVGNLSATFLHRSRHDILMERDVVRDMFWAAFDQFIGHGEY